MNSLLTRAEMEVVDAVASVFFPREGRVGLDADEAGVVMYCDRFIAQLPVAEQVKMRALLQVVEHGIKGQAMNPWARFSRSTPDQQAAFLESLERSDSAAKRGIFQALRSMFTIAWLEHGGVRSALGFEDVESIDEVFPRSTTVAVEAAAAEAPAPAVALPPRRKKNAASAETTALAG
jgi:hypothetical protein